MVPPHHKGGIGRRRLYRRKGLSAGSSRRYFNRAGCPKNSRSGHSARNLLTLRKEAAKRLPLASNAIVGDLRTHFQRGRILQAFASLCQTQVLQAQQSVGEQCETGHLLAQANDVARRPQIDDRQILAHLLPDTFIRGAAPPGVAHRTGAVQQFVHLRVRVPCPIQRAPRCAGNSTRCCRCPTGRTSRPA